MIPANYCFLDSLFWGCVGFIVGSIAMLYLLHHKDEE